MNPEATPLRPDRDLPAWLYLGFAPILLIAIVLVRSLDHAAYRRIFDGELGVIELATPVLAFIAAAFGVATLARARPPRAWLRLWLALVTAGAVYFGGEELSWGQHLVGWRTPPAIEGLNDQQETNLHNISSWFDQKPRLLLELWVLVAGVLVPLARSERAGQGDTPLFRAGQSAARPRRLEKWDAPLSTGDDWRSWFWPTRVCLPTALIAIAIRLPERVKDVLELERLPLEIRYSEPQEYYFALFILLYLASIWRRARPPG